MKLEVIRSGSKGNPYMLISENGILFLGASCQLINVKKAINFQIGEVVGCLATYAHKDHIGYVKDSLSSGIKIYTNDEAKEVVDCACSEWLYGVPEKGMSKVGGFKVTPLYVSHNDIPSCEYLVEHEGMGKLLSAADFKYLPWTLKQQQLNYMLTERNHMDNMENTGPNYEYVMRGYSSLSTVLDAVRRNQALCLRNVILCHLSYLNVDLRQMLAEVGKVAGNCVNVFYMETGLEAELRKELFQGGNKKC